MATALDCLDSILGQTACGQNLSRRSGALNQLSVSGRVEERGMRPEGRLASGCEDIRRLPLAQPRMRNL